MFLYAPLPSGLRNNSSSAAMMCNMLTASTEEAWFQGGYARVRRSRVGVWDVAAG